MWFGSGRKATIQMYRTDTPRWYGTVSDEEHTLNEPRRGRGDGRGRAADGSPNYLRKSINRPTTSITIKWEWEEDQNIH